MVFRHSEGNGGGFAQDSDFEETSVDRGCQVGNLLKLDITFLLISKGP